MDFFQEFKIEEDFLKDLNLLLSKATVKGEKTEEYPFGKDVAMGLEKALEIAKSYGFKTVNMDNYIGYAEYGEGDEYVGVLGHIDVVPVGEGWDSNPFDPVIKEGKIYARGAIDDKGPLMAALYALKLIKEHKIRLDKKVRVIFGTNEESGTEDIDYYLTKEKPPIAAFTPDAHFPIVTSEKGILTFNFSYDMKEESKGYKIDYIKGGKRSNIVPDICQCKFLYGNNENFVDNFSDEPLKKDYNIDISFDEGEVIVTSSGVATHGSTPELGDNAISNLLLYLNKALNFQDEFTKFLEDFNQVIGKGYYGEKLEINFSDEESGPLTLNLGIIEGNASNITMRFNVRYPVTIYLEQILEIIKEKLGKTGFNFVMGNHNPPLHFPKDHPLVKALKKAYEESVGKEAELLAMGGGTYAKLMPNTVAFGPLFEDDENLAHEINENIKISTLEKCIKIYGRAIYVMANEKQ